MSNEFCYPEKYLLKINLQHEITTYLHYSLPLCIIFQNDNLHEWFYERFVQIYFLFNNINNNYSLEYFQRIKDELFCDMISTSYLESKQVSKDFNIINYVIDKINEKNYLIIHLDEYYLYGKSSYLKKHFVHQSLVYGYDNSIERIYTIGFNNNMTFTYMSFDYKMFKNAYDNIKLYYKFGAPWLQFLDVEVQVLKLKEKVDNYLFNLVNFLDELHKYINPKAEFENIKFQPRYSMYRQPDYTIKFGYDIYNMIIEKLKDMVDGGPRFDFRAIHLLSEHKKGILKRLKYISSKYCCHGQFIDLIYKYSLIADEFEINRLKYIKYILVNKDEGLNEKQILIIKQIIQSISVLKDNEKYILKQIYDILLYILANDD